MSLKPWIRDTPYSGNNPVDFANTLIDQKTSKLFARYRHLFLELPESQLAIDGGDQEVTC